MSESTYSTEPNINCSGDRCAGVRECADDLPAHGVRVCGCVYTAHHTPVLTTTEPDPRCADAETRTPPADEDLDDHRREALDRLTRAHQHLTPRSGDPR